MTTTELMDRLEHALHVQSGVVRLRKQTLRALPVPAREVLAIASQIALETLKPDKNQAVRLRRTSRGIYWELADAQ